MNTHKISSTRLNEIIKEEVEIFHKIKSLQEDKKLVEEALLKLETASSKEEIDEIWGGITNVFKKGGQKLGRAALNTVQDMGRDVKDTWNAASDAVNKNVQSVQKAYQQGEAQAARKRAQAQIKQVWDSIKLTQKQLSNLQNQYLNMTGKPFNPRAVAGPKKVAPQQPAPAQAPAQPQANQAA